MAENEIKVRLQSAYKTESEWTASNPILKEGEVGYVADSNVPNYGRYKIGDGATTWKNLPWGDQNIQEKFDDLEIGGRNLLRHTGNLTKWNKEYDISVTPDSDGWYKITNLSHTSSRWGIYQDFSGYEQNTDYTVSLYLKNGSKAGNLSIGYGGSFGTNVIEGSSTETKYSYTFNTGSNTAAMRIYINLSPTEAGQNFYVKLPKLELGNKATDWTPAPEDKADVSHTHPASDIVSGTFSSDRLPTVPVSKGGTGLTTLTSGQALIGNGTGNITTRAIDTTSGGTSGSTSLITSGAVYAGLSGKANSSHSHSYLPLSGGTLSTSTYYGLTIKRSDTNGAAISYQNSSGAIGGAGFLSGGDFQVSSGNNTDGNIFKANTTSAVFPGTVSAPAFTGALNGNANSATKLLNARTIQVNLASTSSASFDGSANITPGVTGTLPIANGGTGATTANAAANMFINSLSVGTATPEDSDYYVSQYANGGTATTSYHRRQMSSLWNYINGKISTVLGLTASAYNGTSAYLKGFTNTTTSATAIDSAIQNGHVYVNGTSSIYSQPDGAAFVQAYSSSWVAQIYQDYFTGQIALRGKNNGTWQSWRKVLDSLNYTSYCLPKTTYEYNKELSLGSSGKVCIGVFPCYDSNISVEIKSTTNITYHGTLIIATQNINTSGGGSYSATVYGDEKNTLTPEIKIQYASGSNAFSIYINLPAWSKNLLHIQCAALAGTPSNIATVVDSIPSTATIVPINAFTHTHNYAGSSSAGGSATSAVKLDSSAGTATQPIYFSGGKPVLCTYGLNATVPSGAVFTDTKVTQTAINASDYTYWRPLVIGNSNSSTEGFTPSSVTDGVITAATITCQPSSGTIRATTFKGALSGNAATATKASQDASGNTITSSYAASLSVSGRTLTLKSKSGATLSTVTTQDTTYSAVTRSSNGLMIASDKVKLDGLIPLTDAEIDEIFNEATSGVEELDSIYPVGSVYISVNHTNPGTILGGTWERFGNGKVLVGVDENDTDFSTAEQSGGEKEHTLTTAEMPSHTHAPGTLSADSVGGHTHSVSASAADNGDHYHHMNQIWSSGSGGSNAYVLSSGRSVGWRNTGNAGTHRHSVSGTAQSNGGHSHTISGASDSTGNGKSHNNLQPYITVYMWLRTA